MYVTVVMINLNITNEENIFIVKFEMSLQSFAFIMKFFSFGKCESKMKM